MNFVLDNAQKIADFLAFHPDRDLHYSQVWHKLKFKIVASMRPLLNIDYHYIFMWSLWRRKKDV